MGIDSRSGRYYLHLRVIPGQQLIRDDDYRDAEQFSRFFGDALELCNARLHAFCWMSRGAHAVIQLSHQPIWRVAQLVTARYSRYLRKAREYSGVLFEHYRAVPLMSDGYFLEAVRWVHLHPVRKGLVHQPGEYRWSSDPTYRGRIRRSWVTTATVRELVPRRYGSGRDAYARWMEDAVDEQLIAEMERVAKRASRHRFDRKLRQLPRRTHTRPLQQIIDGVCERLGVSQAELCSPSQRRAVTEARALVAWRALRSGAATIPVVARHVGKSESALLSGMKRRREKNRALFDEPF